MYSRRCQIKTSAQKTGWASWAGHCARAAGSSGWGFEQFLAHPSIQEELHEQLKLPPTVHVRPSYPTGKQFENEVYLPMLKSTARKELEKYEAPAEKFRDGKGLSKAGLDAARSVIVPPVALFF